MRNIFFPGEQVRPALVGEKNEESFEKTAHNEILKTVYLRAPSASLTFHMLTFLGSLGVFTLTLLHLLFGLMSSGSDTDTAYDSCEEPIPEKDEFERAVESHEKLCNTATKHIEISPQGAPQQSFDDLMEAVRTEDVGDRIKKVEEALYTLEDRRFGALAWRMRKIEDKQLKIELELDYMRNGVARMATDLEKALGQSNTVYFFMKRCQELGEIYAPVAKRRNANAYFGPPPGTFQSARSPRSPPGNISPARSGARPALY
jgi:hypothetical protein